MIEVLQPEDMILQFRGNIINNKLDLSELKENNPKEYNIKFNINGNTINDIEAYIKLTNKSTSQNYLAEKSLNIDINTSELECDVLIPDPKIAELREKDTQGYLSEDLQGGMYRYQASFEDSDSSEMTNWICFGTTDNCGTNEDDIDKYMYRIIGITEEGEMYLLKETFLKEESSTTFSWNDKYSLDSSSSDYCDDGICPEWNTSLLFKRINGTSNGKISGIGTTSDKADTDIFVDSTQYEYLKSGDKINGTKDDKGSEWYQLIADHDWMYGDTIEYNESSYRGDYIYQIENGLIDTRHYIGTKENITQNIYRWSAENKVTGKISLMYINDYLYGYYDGKDSLTRGNPKNSQNVKISWIHFQKDGYNISQSGEWLSTRWGVHNTSDARVFARFVRDYGTNVNAILEGHILSIATGVRPVFYLSKKVKIKEGTDGTKTNPYILDI